MSARNSLLETLLGGVILSLSLFLLGYSYLKTSYGTLEGYPLLARFSRVDGMSVGADVKINGVKVGYVSSIHLSPKTYLAETIIQLQKNIQIPKDSSAEIVGEGLLGAKYLSIGVGGDEVALKAGESIKSTQGSITIDSLISRFMFSKPANKDTKGQ